MELAQVLATEHLRLHRAEIKSPELETPGQRALEASLFIDKKFLDVSVVTGEKTPPELLFGEREWKSYLDARTYARQYGQRSLTVDFITALHKKAANGKDAAKPGTIRNNPIYGGNYNNPSEPVEYTQQELDSIKNNPYLAFQKVEGNSGFILYPASLDGGRVDTNVTKLLQEVCNWYNGEIAKANADPYRLAAVLQRKIISIHLFSDVNGTVSRLLMNWSLENQGKPPSAIDNPSNDILTPEDQWIEAVKNGSDKYDQSEKRLKALDKTGVTDIAFVLGLAPEQAFYNYIFKYIMPPPSFFTINGMQDHAKFEEFFKRFLDDLTTFQSFLQAKQLLGAETVTQGGLISRVFVELTRRNKALADSNLEFTQTRVYRGGRLKDYNESGDESVLDIMSQFTAVESGYWPLSRTGSPSMSARRIPATHIAEGMDYYNQMVANAYFEKARPDDNPYAGIPKLRDVIKKHVSTPEWNSPFASTSLSSSVSHGWATGLGYGVLVKARLPQEGVVMTFSGKIEGVNGLGDEMECLVAGGLNPNFIERAVVFKGNNPVKIAERKGSAIVVSDLTGKFVVRNHYDLIGGNYRLIRTEKTQEDAIDAATTERQSYGHVKGDYGLGDFKNLPYGFKPKESKLAPGQSPSDPEHLLKIPLGLPEFSIPYGFGMLSLKDLYTPDSSYLKSYALKETKEESKTMFEISPVFDHLFINEIKGPKKININEIFLHPNDENLKLQK